MSWVDHLAMFMRRIGPPLWELRPELAHRFSTTGLGYSIEQVDDLLDHLDVQTVRGATGADLAQQIRSARFAMTEGGYNPELVDTHLAALQVRVSRSAGVLV